MAETRFLTNIRLRPDGPLMTEGVCGAAVEKVEERVDHYDGTIETLIAKISAQTELIAQLYAQLDRRGLLDAEALEQITPYSWEIIE
tara:strand:- start:42 stop:302 length:261 start_codon:yes stop_codon:yes gene_type:complete